MVTRVAIGFQGANYHHVKDKCNKLDKEMKNAPSALLSCISTREFLRTQEKCTSFSSVLKNSRNKFFISFIK